MTKEEPERIKQGYQPSPSKNAGVIPPNTGSHVRMKENEYTWKDLDKAWWEGFDNAKNKMEKRIADLEKENAELREKLLQEREIYWSKGFEYSKKKKQSKNLTKAKEIIKNILQALANEDSEFTFALKNTHPVLTEAEQFLKEVSE